MKFDEYLDLEGGWVKTNTCSEYGDNCKRSYTIGKYDHYFCWDDYDPNTGIGGPQNGTFYRIKKKKICDKCNQEIR